VQLLIADKYIDIVGLPSRVGGRSNEDRLQFRSVFVTGLDLSDCDSWIAKSSLLLPLFFVLISFRHRVGYFSRSSLSLFFSFSLV
jgi:hypothetical protein